MQLFGVSLFLIFFFFNDTATTEIYTLSLHDALPIWVGVATVSVRKGRSALRSRNPVSARLASRRDRKSTRLNSSHSQISYAVFCLKKKKKNIQNTTKPQRTSTSTKKAQICAGTCYIT